MIKRRPYNEAPDAVKHLVVELEKHGDYLVYEDEHHRPVVSIAPAKARRLEGVREMKALLDTFPSYPYPEEEIHADIEQAIQATREPHVHEAPSRAGD